MRAILLIGLMLAPGAAWAGCANFTDGSLSTPAPQVEICAGSECEITTTDFACGNVHGAQYGYANGWRVEYWGEDDAAGYKLVNGVRTSMVTGADVGGWLWCRAIDDNRDACFPLSKSGHAALPIGKIPTPEPKP